MAVERCTRCERWINLEWERIEYLDDEPVCHSCLTDDELEALDGKPDIKKAGK